MAAPTLTLLAHTEIDDADSSTGWVNLTTADTDLKVEGTASMSGITRNDGEDSYYDNGGAPVTGAGKTLRGWVNTTNMAYMGSFASNPYSLWVYDGSSQSNGIALFGSDTYFGGWFYFWQSMDDFTGVTLANVDRWGIEAGHDSNAKNVTNMWMDVLRYLDGYSLTGGTSGDKITLASVELADRGATTLYGYGVVTEKNGVYFGTGTVQVGSGSTTTYFEMDGEVFVFVDPPGDLTVDAGLYEINVQGSGCNAVIKNSVLRAGGTGDSTRVVLDFSDTNATLSFTDNLVNRAGTVTFASGQTATGNTFDDCGQITHAGATMNNCTIKDYEGTAGTAALIYNVNADPDGETDDLSFTKGTASTHAIELGTNTPSSITLRGWTVSGYNSANGNNDSVIYNNSGKAITVNVVGNSGTISYRNGSGASTTIVANPVTLSVHVQDAVSGADISGARVYILVDTTGPLPYEDSVTITRSSTTATVSHTAHGLSTNQWVKIEGADQEDYNGAKQITKIDADSYSYTVANSPTTPATGTITSTAIIIFGTTDGSGDISDTRTYSSDQDFTGRVRKSSASPYYKTSTLLGTIDSTNGLSVTVGMISDE